MSTTKASASVTLGPSASEQWISAPDHLAMVLARYRAASALIGTSHTVLEVGCGEGIGARILARGRSYLGVDADGAAVEAALATLAEHEPLTFTATAVEDLALRAPVDSVVALDVIEHVEAIREHRFLAAIVRNLLADGVFVVGTPSEAFAHLASARSREEHINTYTHARLLGLMRRYFLVVQSFGMQDTSLHLGHPDARHYLLLCGIGLR